MGMSAATSYSENAIDTFDQSVLQGYKRTEIGFIPEDWKVAILRSCLLRSPSYGINAGAVVFDDDLPTYLRITDIDEGSRFNPNPRVSVKHPMSIAFFLNEGDLVFARTGASVGKSYLYKMKDGPLVFAGFLIRVQPDPRVLDPAFLAYYVQSKRYWNWVATMSVRSGQPGINSQEYGKLQVPTPIIEEQQAIAEALSDVDALIESLEKLIAKKRDVKQATMQQLLTGKTRLPGFSGEWEVKALAELFNFSGGYSASRDQLSSEGYCYLHYGDIHGATKTFIDTRSDFQDIPKLNISLKKISSRSLLKDGDVVFVDASEDDDGTSRHVVVVNKDEVPFISGLHTIVANSKTDELAHEYRRYCFQTQAIRQQFLFYAVGTKVSGISKTNIAKITLPVPKIPEQTAIAAVLSDMDTEIFSFEQRLEKAKQIKQGMMQQLLTGKVRLVSPQKTETPV